MHRRSIALALAGLALACASTPTGETESRERHREELLSTVKGLAGRWRMTAAEAQGAETELAVTSQGSAVREVMFPGAAHEMTNMYHLDGDALVLTHYCAQGNQPRMVARRKDGNTIAFVLDEVSDLKSEDELCMGEMTLEIVDARHMRQHWRAFRGSKLDHEVTFDYERR
jgi:hypothetical protein